jgi:hypothetical protein
MPAIITVNDSEPLLTSQLEPSTHVVHGTLRPWSPSANLANAQGVLRDTSVYTAQHIMGFGAPNPWETSTMTAETMNWTFLDERIELIEDAGQIPVLTVGMAPTWMLDGGTDGTTDWGRIEDRPTQANFGNFAELARRVAERYQGRVHHYQIWNEFKGFWNTSLNRWDHELYVEMYDLCYAAIKGEDSNNLVGGPYNVIRPHHDGWDSGYGTSSPYYVNDPSYGTLDTRNMHATAYFFEEAVGYDFIVLDADSVDVQAWEAPEDPVASTIAMYRDILAWTRGYDATAPIWLAEYYGGILLGEEPAVPVGRMLISLSIMELARGGASVIQLWKPEDSALEYDHRHHALWVDAIEDDGTATPFAAVHQAYREVFAPSTPIYEATTDNPDLRCLATDDYVCVINTSDTAHDVSVDGVQATVDPYDTVFLPRTSSGSVRTRVAYDTFTNTDFTALAEHTSDSDHDWIQRDWAGSSQILSVFGNRAFGWYSSNTGLYTIDAAPSGDEYDVQATMHRLDDGGSTLTGVVGWVDLTNERCYQVTYDEVAEVWQLVLANVGAEGYTVLDTHAATFTENSSHDVVLMLRDGSQEVTLDGTTILTATDTVISPSPHAGIRIGSPVSDTTGIHMDEFELWDIGDPVTTQLARPASDISAGSWTPTPLHVQLADDSPSVYVQSEDNPDDDMFIVALEALDPPVSLNDHVLRFSYARDVADGDPIDLTVELLQGETVIASDTVTPTTDSWVTGQIELTEQEAEVITDYSNLRVRVTASQGSA